MKLLWTAVSRVTVCLFCSELLPGLLAVLQGCWQFGLSQAYRRSGSTNVPPKCNLQQCGCSWRCFSTPQFVVIGSGCGGCGGEAVAAGRGVNPAGEKAAHNPAGAPGPRSLPRTGKGGSESFVPFLLNREHPKPPAGRAGALWGSEVLGVGSLSGAGCAAGFGGSPRPAPPAAPDRCLRSPARSRTGTMGAGRAFLGRAGAGSQRAGMCHGRGHLAVPWPGCAGMRGRLRALRSPGQGGGTGGTQWAVPQPRSCPGRFASGPPAGNAELSAGVAAARQEHGVNLFGK